ncbi:MAG TPA: L-aspartate oxidase [Gammaproteobacteria bacterium]|nr:L-aspartate oxidase [Gammaproteobacteria bacterium]|tara:strand:+ start:1070 stop:2716 length:1647 start_codon:yes stop_codon:yes gene_type:complete
MNEIRDFEKLETDLVVVGSGAAGLTLALRTADFARVTVLSKGDLQEGATYYAQGGIAAVLDDSDSVDSHVEDTLHAGVGLCHRDVVEHVVEHSASAVSWLVTQGVPFTTKSTAEANSNGDAPVNPAELASLHLTQEGGHSHRRIIHATDATGRAVFQTLQRRAREHTNITLLEGCTAVDLVTELSGTGRTCVGVYVLVQASGRVEAVRSRFVALATGGASKAYLYTSNPDGASGDGIAMAWRAGCRVANLEFNQFHPTCLYHPHAKSFLITEALRGEGAYLELPDGTRFMPDFDDLAELAPRDIVARAIDHEMKRLGCDCVYLNITHKPADFVKAHFPNIYERCLCFGIDITRDRIPVVPAAHYTCGGVMVNTQGETNISNLYAIGETSFSGLHGANRMASNSLLECFVIAFGAADSIRARFDRTTLIDRINPWDESRVTDSDDEVLVSHDWDEIRRFMWDFVGIVRTSKRLQRARSRISVIREEVRDYYIKHRVTNDNLELRNLALVAELIVNSALQRQESRGLHFTLDFPDTLARAKDTILSPEDS